MKIRNKHIIRKLQKRTPTKNTQNNNQILLRKYHHLKNNLCDFDSLLDIIWCWFVTSFAFIGFAISFYVIFALLSNRPVFIFDLPTIAYTIIGIFIGSIHFFIDSILILYIVNSKLSIEEKIDRLENKKLIIGYPLLVAKIIFFILSIMSGLTVLLYFNQIEHPLIISVFVYLFFTLSMNTIRHTTSGGYVIYFLVLSFLLYIMQLCLYLTLLDVEEDRKRQKEIEDAKSIGQVIAESMYELSLEDEKEHELLYKQKKPEKTD